MTRLGQKHSHRQCSETAFSRADAETPWAVLAQARESRPIWADMGGGRSNRVWLNVLRKWTEKWYEPEPELKIVPFKVRSMLLNPSEEPRHLYLSQLCFHSCSLHRYIVDLCALLSSFSAVLKKKKQDCQSLVMQLSITLCCLLPVCSRLETDIQKDIR